MAAFCFLVAAPRDSVQPDPPACATAMWGSASGGERVGSSNLTGGCLGMWSRPGSPLPGHAHTLPPPRHCQDHRPVHSLLPGQNRTPPPTPSESWGVAMRVSKFRWRRASVSPAQVRCPLRLCESKSCQGPAGFRPIRVRESTRELSAPEMGSESVLWGAPPARPPAAGSPSSVRPSPVPCGCREPPCPAGGRHSSGCTCEVWRARRVWPVRALCGWRSLPAALLKRASEARPVLVPGCYLCKRGRNYLRKQ